MSLPFINFYVAKMFMSPLFLVLGVAYFFEGLRRAYLGGLSLGLFIDISSNPPESCKRDLEYLRAFLDKEKEQIEAIPETAWPLIGPWIDHHNAVECFYEIACMLCQQKAGLFPTGKTCQEIWAAQP